MGTCWPKLKFKAAARSHHHHNHYHNDRLKNKKNGFDQKHSQNKHLTVSKQTAAVSTQQQQSPQTTPLQNDTNESVKKQLQPRRDLESSLNGPAATAVATTSVTTTTTTSTNNFKQFCKNSADKLTHKLSFNSHRTSSSSSKQTSDNNDMVNEGKINALFDKYKDNKDSILANGVQQLCDDLTLKPDDFKVLLLAWKMNAKQMCRFTRDEFTGGFKNALRVDNLKDLRLKLAYLEDVVKNNQNEFRDLYRWSFDFGLDSDTGERAIPIDMAISLWELVYINQEPPILAKWIKFLRDHSNIKGIPRDTWNMFPLFCKSIGESNFHLYDDNEAWPCLFDDFVQSEIAKLNDVKIDINNNNNNSCDNS